MCSLAIAVGCIRTNHSTRLSHSRFNSGSGMPAASRCRRVVRRISGGTTPRSFVRASANFGRSFLLQSQATQGAQRVSQRESQTNQGVHAYHEIMRPLI